MREAINTGNLDILDEVISPTVVDHDPAPDQAPGPEGSKGFFTTLRAGFPDLQVEVEHLVTDDQNVAFAYRISGTHQGEFQGVAPTGRRIDARGMQISRFEDGKIVERWGSSDEAGIMKQLGQG
jgi:predicted ester cyclase